MGTLSLTPRETSSGLRPPRLAAGPGGGGDGGGSVRVKPGGLPPARGAIGRPDHDDDEPPPIPTREALRMQSRMLRERRVGKAAPPDPAMRPQQVVRQWLALQGSVSKLLDNDGTGDENATGIRQQLEKKAGLFRMNMISLT